ncbi:MAG: hypothetical protein ABI528_00590 [bacterium]
MLGNKQSVQKDGNFISVEIEVYILKEGDYFVSYCPALELSSFDDTEEGAIAAFEEVLEIFLEETERKRTLEQELLKFGWSLVQKPEPRYTPPVSNHFDGVSNFISSIREQVRIPIPA